MLISANFVEKNWFLTIFLIFLHSFMVRDFWETNKLKQNFQKWIQKFTKIILEISSVSISSKLVDIFGLKALCTEAWQKNRTLKRDFKAMSLCVVVSPYYISILVGENEKHRIKVRVFLLVMFLPPMFSFKICVKKILCFWKSSPKIYFFIIFKFRSKN